MKEKIQSLIIVTILCGFIMLSILNQPLIAKGLINNPQKLAIYASPPILIANNLEFSGLTIQVLDASGNPTIAPQNLVIYLTVSDTSILTLSTTSITISKGTSCIIGLPTSNQPWARSTNTPGVATITASAIGFDPASVSIETKPASANPIAKIAAYAAPPLLLIHDSCGLTVQLLDASNNPAKAPTGGVVVALSSNDSMRANPSVSSVTIPAGSSYLIGRPTNANPWVSTTYIPGAAAITASAIGMGTGKAVIKTNGDMPYRLRIYAAPLRLRADGSTFAKLTVQLLDKKGNPAIAPTGGIAVTFTCSNTTVIDLVEFSATIGEGRSYWRTYYSWGWKGPRAKTTTTPGEATIAAISLGLVSDQVKVTTYTAITNTPSKLAIYAEPANLIPDATFYDDSCSRSYMTVQLLDSNNLPALAPTGGTIVSLGSNDTSAITLSTSSVMVQAGANFVSGGDSGYPWCSATSLPGKALVTATSVGLSFANVIVSTLEAGLQPTMPTTVTIALSKYNITQGESVTVYGKLTDITTGLGIPNAPIKLSYSTNGGVTWNYAATISTNLTGWYKGTGAVPSPGTYLIKAEYLGSSIYLPSSAVSQLLKVWPLPSTTYLFFNCTPNPASPGQTIALRGILVYVDSGNIIHPIANAVLTITYSADYGQTWQPAGTVTTGSNGMFLKTFTAPSVGVYLFKLVYAGSQSYKPTTSSAFLVVR